MGVKLVAIRKDQSGKITHFLTNEEKIISFQEAEELVQEGKIDSITSIREDGTWEVDLPIAYEWGSNLDQLPEF